ncbi:MAG: ADP-forming succinate--CoA ligase subunit beta [Deltaproteobacteria bacterium]|nr:ADP-forming succinate--CoA ligase subunit beta [Deltaproteobacteria bacterium]
MKIHEYQAKELFRKHGLPVPDGFVASSADEAREVAQRLDSNMYVVKAQIHAGGRGKGGGVKVVSSLDEVYNIAKQMIGSKLITHQTGPEGKEVNKVLIEEGLGIASELYLGIVIDRAQEAPVVIASASGGMDIEEVAAKNPGAIKKEVVDLGQGLLGFQARNLAYALDLQGGAVGRFVKTVQALYRMFLALDCSMVEINPLVVTKDDRLIALDAKVAFDDNALFRHPELKDLIDPTEADPLELEAGKYNLNYIRLDGNIGCMVNGAGLAMATMDVIKLAGAEPANFLDVGGGASTDMIRNGFRIILEDPRVKGILINIFGGILRCDILAQGVIEAAEKIGVEVPLIVRLEGTNVDKGQEMLKNSGLNFTVANTILDAAEMVTKIVGRAS